MLSLCKQIFNRVRGEKMFWGAIKSALNRMGPIGQSGRTWTKAMGRSKYKLQVIASSSSHFLHLCLSWLPRAGYIGFLTLTQTHSPLLNKSFPC